MPTKTPNVEAIVRVAALMVVIAADREACFHTTAGAAALWGLVGAKSCCLATTVRLLHRSPWTGTSDYKPSNSKLFVT
jgi:hypothetical protein